MSKFDYLKVGDKVAIKIYGAPYILETVTRRTTSYVWINNEAFDIESGFKVGEKSNRRLLTDSETELAINLYKITKLRKLSQDIVDGLDLRFAVSDPKQLTDDLFERLCKHCEVKKPT